MTDVTDEIFQDMMAGLNEALAHTKGEPTPGMVVHVPETLDVAAIRKRAGLSQAAFAKSIGVNASTLKQWEQGRRSPQGPAQVLLAMLEQDPYVVRRTLSGEERTVHRGKALPAQGAAKLTLPRNAATGEIQTTPTGGRFKESAPRRGRPLPNKRA